jgi:hypothetical protein
MAEKRIERRLAAILAADVASYSRLMGIDEEGTHEALKAHRDELVDEISSPHTNSRAEGNIQTIARRGSTVWEIMRSAAGHAGRSKPS